MRSVLATVAFCSLFVGAAEAALLTNIQGQASINRGNGFVPATGPVDLKPGDQVLTGNGGAQLQYSLTCTATIGPNQLILVQAQSPCAAQQGQAGSEAGLGGISTTNLIVGGLVIGGGVAAAIALSQASP